MPRFVILEHDYPVPHWDLMLESGPVLRTWRLAEAPVPGKTVAAESSFNHRLFYLEYEGPLTNNRGSVTRWLAGEFEFIRDEPQVIEIAFRSLDRDGFMSIVRQTEDQWSVRAQR